MRGETWIASHACRDLFISIHSPHARGDLYGRYIFNMVCAFQSTPLMRGETTLHHNIRMFHIYFNPLPSCEGRLAVFCLVGFDLLFQSTPLMRGETVCRTETKLDRLISIHSPHARGDAICNTIFPCNDNFNPLPSCEGRPYNANWSSYTLEFQSTPLMRGETACNVAILSCVRFQSTPLMRGETQGHFRTQPRVKISIHSPHARGDYSVCVVSLS